MLSFSVSTSRGARTRRRRKGRTRPGRRGQRSRGCGERIDAARVPWGTPAGRPRTRNAPRARTSRALSVGGLGQKHALFRRKTTDTTTTVVASFSRHIDVTRRSTTRCPGAGTENHHAGRGSGKAPGAARRASLAFRPPRRGVDAAARLPTGCQRFHLGAHRLVDAWRRGTPRPRGRPRAHASGAVAAATAARGDGVPDRARGRGGPPPRRRFVDAAARRHRRRHEHELDVILHRDAKKKPRK